MKDSFELIEGVVGSLSDKIEDKLYDRTKKILEGKEKKRLEKKIDKLKKASFGSGVRSAVKASKNNGVKLTGYDCGIQTISNDNYSYTCFSIYMKFKKADGHTYNKKVYTSVALPTVGSRNGDRLRLISKYAKKEASQFYTEFKKVYEKQLNSK